MQNLSWDDAMIAELEWQWKQGKSAGEIAKAMDISRNAVIGKAHRLKLPARPSPIVR